MHIVTYLLQCRSIYAIPRYVECGAGCRVYRYWCYSTHSLPSIDLDWYRGYRLVPVRTTSTDNADNADNVPCGWHTGLNVKCQPILRAWFLKDPVCRELLLVWSFQFKRPIFPIRPGTREQPLFSFFSSSSPSIPYWYYEHHERHSAQLWPCVLSLQCLWLCTSTPAQSTEG